MLHFIDVCVNQLPQDPPNFYTLYSSAPLPFTGIQWVLVCTVIKQTVLKYNAYYSQSLLPLEYHFPINTLRTRLESVTHPLKNIFLAVPCKTLHPLQSPIIIRQYLQFTSITFTVTMSPSIFLINHLIPSVLFCFRNKTWCKTNHKKHLCISFPLLA